MSVLDDPGVRNALRQAWYDSQPDELWAHEEGGFILRLEDGTFAVDRWPHGEHNRVIVPEHAGCRRGGFVIVASFHTHPHPPPDYKQEPSRTDIRGICLDPDLAHPDYQGEYVIARTFVYQIHRDGSVTNVGETSALLNL
jgi:hypothetical protein